MNGITLKLYVVQMLNIILIIIFDTFTSLLVPLCLRPCLPSVMSQQNRFSPEPQSLWLDPTLSSYIPIRSNLSPKTANQLQAATLSPFVLYLFVEQVPSAHLPLALANVDFLQPNSSLSHISLTAGIF